MTQDLPKDEPRNDDEWLWEQEFSLHESPKGSEDWRMYASIAVAFFAVFVLVLMVSVL